MLALNLAILEELPVLSTHLLTVMAIASLGLSNLAHAIMAQCTPECLRRSSWAAGLLREP